MNDTFSRRDTLKLMANMGIATFAGGAMLRSRSVFAQQTTAVLGHFGSANPQTLGKASGSFAKAFGFLIAVIALVSNQRRVLLILGVLSVLLAVVLLGSASLFVLDALQTDELCPCNWKKGDEFLKAA